MRASSAPQAARRPCRMLSLAMTAFAALMLPIAVHFQTHRMMRTLHSTLFPKQGKVHTPHAAYEHGEGGRLHASGVVGRTPEPLKSLIAEAREKKLAAGADVPPPEAGKEDNEGEAAAQVAALQADTSPLHSTRPKAAASPDISPLSLHFVWVTRELRGQAAVPASVQKNIKAWAAMNARWNVSVWDNDRIREFFPEQVQLLSRLGSPAWISDIVRLCVIERFGGLYLDADIIPVRAVDSVVSALSPFVVCKDTELQEKSKGKEKHSFSPSSDLLQISYGACRSGVTSAIIASPPHNGAIRSLRDEVIWRTGRRIRKGVLSYSELQTGPQMLSEPRHMLLLSSSNFTLLQKHTFEACIGGKAGRPCDPKHYGKRTDVFGMHVRGDTDSNAP